jgi:hypothetical protein
LALGGSGQLHALEETAHGTLVFIWEDKNLSPFLEIEEPVP